jgi:hypothetical protein
MGRELFDYFKVYANRWKFKHPTQKTFFRMEDASAVDLDWFFRVGFILLIL